MDLTPIEESLQLQWLAGTQLRRASFYVGEKYVLHVYFHSNSQEPADTFTSENRLVQESKYQNIGNGYQLRFDRNLAYQDPAKDHIHVYKKNRQLTAVNRDGTAHDGFHGTRIPSKVADYIRNEFWDFELPNNNFIESCEPAVEQRIERLLENG